MSLVFLALVLLAGCTALKQCAYEGFGRDEWQQPETVIRSLGIGSGDHVADLGSGSGYFTFRLAKTVGPAGKVYAVDIDRGLNDALASRSQAEAIGNIEVILAKPDDPLLPPGAVDLIFTSNTYHHIENRARYFANARKYLRPGGRVAIIDFNSNDWLASLGGHYTSGDTIKQEMLQAGYTVQEEFNFVERQSFIVFAPSDSSK
jgi:arsenite methyltransferase